MAKPFDSVEINEKQKLTMDDFRRGYSMLHDMIIILPQSRELSLAITNLEQSSMWLNKAISNLKPEDLQ